MAKQHPAPADAGIAAQPPADAATQGADSKPVLPSPADSVPPGQFDKPADNPDDAGGNNATPAVYEEEQEKEVPEPPRNPLIGTPQFDVDNADEEELYDHVRIMEMKARARKLASDLISPTPPAAPQATAPPQATSAPATFTAPSAPLVSKYNTETQQTVHMPQKLWDGLSDEDKPKFSEVAPKPEKLETNA